MKFSGKNLFFDHIIKPLFGEKQAMVVDDDRLQSDFNGFILNKLFIAFNEVASVDTSSKRSVKSKIKAIISDEKALINENHHLSIFQMKDLFMKTFLEWKGDNKQMDDILVTGIKF